MKKIIISLIILVVLGLIFFTVDYNRVKNQKKPLFCIYDIRGSYQDGGTQEYLGLGYKVIDFHKLESFLSENVEIVITEENSVVEAKDFSVGVYDKIHIGSWFMTYDSALRQRENGVVSVAIKPVEFKRTYTVLEQIEKNERKYNFYAIEKDYWKTPTVIKLENTFEIEENSNYEFTFRGNSGEGMVSGYTISEIFEEFEVVGIENVEKLEE